MTPIPFQNSYARLPDRFFARTDPTPAPAPRLVALNRPLAADLGIDPDLLASPDGAAILAGARVPDGAEPLAAAYAGHQFGSFVPQLGDGRAILLGEVVDREGRRRDIQLKGSGPTPFSRRGDGRAALGPVLREYLVSEAMHALGIPTTRSLAAALTGEAVVRETMLPGAVLTRVAASHIRVGTFQYFAARGDQEGVRTLADHVVARHYPHLAAGENPYLALLRAVVEAQAELIARWLQVGFVHGVMNTDNCSVAGETIDYGPCAFLDAYDPAAVFSSIDAGGRYAYGNQPRIVQWNLARLAETLLPLIAPDADAAVALATEALDAFAPRFTPAYRGGMRRKLGLTTEREGDDALADSLLRLLAENEGDFTLAFRGLADAAEGRPEPVRSRFIDPTAFDGWAPAWLARLDGEPGGRAGAAAGMRAVNPAFIPRNHRIEAVIRAAVEDDDFGPFHALHRVLQDPFGEQPEHAAYRDPPALDERVTRTFCGT